MKKESSCSTKRKALFFAAIAFAVILLLPIASSSSNNDFPVTATRTIHKSKEPIMPEEKILFDITLEVKKKVENSFIIIEKIPEGWSPAKEGNEGWTLEDSKSKLKYTEIFEKTDTIKTLSYSLVAPTKPKEKYQISGNIILMGTESPVDAGVVGGDTSIPVEPAYINPKPTESSTNLTVWIAVAIAGVIILGVFLSILLLGWHNDHSLNKGEMRRAIAGAFVAAFIILVLFSITNIIMQNDVIPTFINSAVIILGFYFGAKTAGTKETEAKDQIDIENVNFVNEKEAKITMRNNGNNIIKVDKIYVNDESVDLKEKDVILSKESKEIVINLTEGLLKSDKENKVRAVTSNGVPVEKKKTYKKD